MLGLVPLVDGRLRVPRLAWWVTAEAGYHDVAFNRNILDLYVPSIVTFYEE